MTMTQLETVKHVLFDEQELNAANFKLFPGSSRDVTSEQMAAEINRSIEAILHRDFDVVERFDD
jgi:hypothetical protein